MEPLLRVRLVIHKSRMVAHSCGCRRDQGCSGRVHEKTLPSSCPWYRTSLNQGQNTAPRDGHVNVPNKLERRDLNIPAPPSAAPPHDPLSQASELPFRLLPSWCVIGVPSSQSDRPIGPCSREYSLCCILPLQEGKGSDGWVDRSRPQLQHDNRASIHGV